MDAMNQVHVTYILSHTNNNHNKNIRYVKRETDKQLALVDMRPAICGYDAKRGYQIAIFVWSLGSCLHAGCGWLTMNIEGLDSIEALRAVEAGSALALAIATVSVYLFLTCRLILAMG